MLRLATPLRCALLWFGVVSGCHPAPATGQAAPQPAHSSSAPLHLHSDGGPLASDQRPLLGKTIAPPGAALVKEPAATARHPAEPTSESRPKPTTAFPDQLLLGKPTEVAMDSDRSLRVTHAAGDNLHPLIYLHGMCGNSKGADPWADIAAQYGTLIVVRANERCPDRPGYRWPKDVTEIQERIDAALLRVKALRQGWLDTDRPTIIGYSQGSYRAEQLVAAYPGRYDRAMLGGPPTALSYDALQTLQSVAVLGGELEDHEHMLLGATELAEKGLRARFFLLPKVHHGSYGPEGRRVVGEALQFLFDPVAATEHSN